MEREKGGEGGERRKGTRVGLRVKGRNGKIFFSLLPFSSLHEVLVLVT